MKKATLLATLLLTLYSAMATIRTVSNNPATLAQFNTIQAAIDASADGDTLYVHGSPNVYAGFTLLDKRVVIIGPGWAPDKQLPLTATLSGSIHMRNSSAAGTPSGSEYQGLVLNSDVNITSGGSGDIAVNNISFRRCQFNNIINFQTFSASGLLFEGNVFYHQLFFGASQTFENVLFQNNIFFFQTCCLSFQISGLFNSVNVRFDHNLFYSSNNGAPGSVPVFTNSRFLTFTNNIFNQVNVGSGVSFSTYNNNITHAAMLSPSVATAAGTPWAVNSNVDGGGNVSNQIPLVFDQAAVESGNSSPLLNFTIANGPANNSGSDGKDMGLLFDPVGSLNWANSRNSRLPRIFSMSVVNPTVAAGATLNVTVTAKASN